MQYGMEYGCNTTKQAYYKNKSKKEGEGMAKISKTYRLSEEVVEAIESRDREDYPTANEFVEKAVLQFTGSKADTNLLYDEMKYIRLGIEDVKNMLSEVKNETGKAVKRNNASADIDFEMPQI